MQTERHRAGTHPNSRRNLELTPAQRKENVEKIRETRRRRGNEAMEKLYLRAVEMGLEGKTGPEMALALEVSKGVALRMKRWAKTNLKRI